MSEGNKLSLTDRIQSFSELGTEQYNKIIWIINDCVAQERESFAAKIAKFIKATADVEDLESVRAALFTPASTDNAQLEGAVHPKAIDGMIKEPAWQQDISKRFAATVAKSAKLTALLDEAIIKCEEEGCAIHEIADYVNEIARKRDSQKVGFPYE